MTKKIVKLFIAVCCLGAVMLGTFTVLIKNKKYMPPEFPGKRDITKTTEIPFTLRDEFLKEKRMTCDCSADRASPRAIYERTEVESRRKLELLKFKERTESYKETLLIVDGSVPLSYPAHGVVVVPEEWEDIPGLKVVDYIERDHYKVILSSSKFGVLNIRANVSGIIVDGLGTTSLTISSRSLAHLNRQLEFVVYVNTVFDIDARDFVRFVYLEYEAVFPILVRVRRPPILYDPGPASDINEKVTIITKTFLRYPSVKLLLQSIHKYYPKMRVVVADDGRPIQDLQSEHVDHYVMPFASGWFGGRNLGVSQVTTPYLLWVDDDFIFTEATKLEVMVDILDNSNLDVVSGICGGGSKRLYAARLSVIPGEHDNDGVCISQKLGKNYGQVHGFPDCYLTTRVTNFFMGRTDEIRSVGFYPKYSRFADKVFFLEALGKLRMAACRGIAIDHKPEKSGEYKKFRYGRDIANFTKYMTYIRYSRIGWDCTLH